MRPAHVIEIQTPKKFLLNGLLFGPVKPKKVIILIHGLGSSAFSKLRIVDELINKETAVLTFNNRGHDRVSNLVPLNGKRGALAGEAYEVFTESVDDIDGAIRAARKTGAKEIYLAGHSTGCQKAAYWAYTKKGKGIQGIILLAPLSDYAASVMQNTKGRLAKATAHARKLVKAKKGNELMPTALWSELHSAQRFLSLNTPESIEQSIFPYFDAERGARIYEALRVPVLVVLAEKDEFADRDAGRIEAWFVKHSHSKRFGITTIPKVTHGFRGGETAVATLIGEWISA